MDLDLTAISSTANSFTVNNAKWIVSQTYASTSSHCCACAGACWHTGSPTYCPNHSTYTPVIGTGTGTGNFPIWSNIITVPIKCDVCDELLSVEDVSASKRMCSECRHVIAVFKTILVAENKEDK